MYQALEIQKMNDTVLTFDELDRQLGRQTGKEMTGITDLV